LTITFLLSIINTTKKGVEGKSKIPPPPEVLEIPLNYGGRLK
jgi:hypothetical protein